MASGTKKTPASSLRQRRPSNTAAQTVVDAARKVESKVEQALLVLWDELPSWRRDNAYIVRGYRQTSNSYWGSFASLGYLHNETVNIWSHLLGALVFTVGAVVLHSVIAPRYESASDADLLVFSCFFAGAFLCLGMSATYHTLSNHSPSVAKWGNKLDYTGIVLLIVGSYVPAIYYGFVCLPTLVNLYLSVISLLGLGCLAVSWFDHFRAPAWRPYRALMFVGLGASGVVPILQDLRLHGYQDLNERMGLSWVIFQGALYIFGAFLYASRWPERQFPGTVDIFGSSHQIFHICVVLAAASHLYGMVKAFDYRHSVLGAQC
ncbi:hemolysin-III related-domain-containing protein [Lasiosphaeria miniovina]|uniref:Hemolysin-III related-domain-containing protein n=1 Tax=Lasiosphaeria miniovina TaxID=1954250 RepID=A0AA40AL81_9PEZI|nr:hemolysin-III related-domain-containing protein [Lasiosphaeria miniovina]KAK0717916.1 hemolysin-III related-domain-containing protein [Lasiosphaeria miniovina]